MNHFTTQDKLKTFLQAEQVTALFAKIPAAELETPFTTVDSFITAKTGEEPDATDNYPILVSIASRLLIWNLSGNQQWNDTNKPELDRREKLNNAALSELDDIANGDIQLEPAKEESTGSAFGADYRRTRNW